LDLLGIENFKKSEAIGHEDKTKGSFKQ